MKTKILIAVAVGWSVLTVSQAAIGLVSIYVGRDYRHSTVLAMLFLILANQTWAAVRNDR